MIINVKVDVTEAINELFYDFNPEDNTVEIDLKDIIKNEIVQQAKRAILQDGSFNIKTQMTNEIKKLVSESYEEHVGLKCAEFVRNGKLKGRYGNSEDVTVDEWIRLQFEHTGNYNRLPDIVKKKAEETIKEIKNRYDLLFASQMITKLNEQNLLKDGVFKALMETK